MLSIGKTKLDGILEFLKVMQHQHHKIKRVCETQMLPIFANSKDGQNHKEKSSNIYYLEILTNVVFFLSKDLVKYQD